MKLNKNSQIKKRLKPPHMVVKGKINTIYLWSSKGLELDFLKKMLQRIPLLFKNSCIPFVLNDNQIKLRTEHIYFIIHMKIQIEVYGL